MKVQNIDLDAVSLQSVDDGWKWLSLRLSGLVVKGVFYEL